MIKITDEINQILENATIVKERIKKLDDEENLKDFISSFPVFFSIIFHSLEISNGSGLVLTRFVTVDDSYRPELDIFIKSAIDLFIDNEFLDDYRFYTDECEYDMRDRIVSKVYSKYYDIVNKKHLDDELTILYRDYCFFESGGCDDYDIYEPSIDLQIIFKRILENKNLQKYMDKVKKKAILKVSLK